jgi:uncharacterized Zn-finger protein
MAASNPLTPPETIFVDDVTVACDGPGGAGGHPRVYLSLEGKGEAECPYCDRLYVLKAGGKPAAH